MKKSKHKQNEWEEINDRFYYLPEGGITAAVLAFPFALYAGLEAERFDKILDGSEPDFTEIEIIIWACDIGLNIIRALAVDDLSAATDLFNKAMEIAAEYLDQDEARKALDLTVRSLKDENNKINKFN